MLSNISLNSQIESDERVGCLDIREFVDGKTFKRLAFVQKVKSGVSVYETGYYTFYVKDVNGNVLAARLFNVKNFIESGFTASLYKNKPVIMEFSSQIYNGQWSLVVDKIDLWTGDFPFARFRGSVDAAKDFITGSTNLSITNVDDETTKDCRSCQNMSCRVESCEKPIDNCIGYIHHDEKQQQPKNMVLTKKRK